MDNLQVLINEVENGSVLQLSSDVVLTTTAVVTKSLTIDLNGYTISNSEDIWNEETKSWSLISVRKNGSLTIFDGSKAGTGSLHAKENDCFAIDVQAGGILTIESGSYVGNISSIYVHTGIAYIKGGYYEVQQLEPTSKYGQTVNCYDANYRNGTAKIVITGGSFYNFNPTDAAEPEDCEQSYLDKNTRMVYDEDAKSYVVTKVEFKIVTTVEEKVENLPIKDGQLIFVQDNGAIAFDFNGERKFYGQDKSAVDEKIETVIEENKKYTDEAIAKAVAIEVVEF